MIESLVSWQQIYASMFFVFLGAVALGPDGFNLDSQRSEEVVKLALYTAYGLLIASGFLWVREFWKTPQSLYQPASGLFVVLYGIVVSWFGIFRTKELLIGLRELEKTKCVPWKGLLILLVIGCMVAAAQLAFGATNPVTYRGCYDGDTCRFDIPGLGYYLRVRLVGVDTPEMEARCATEQFRAIAARDYTNRMLAGARRIELIPEGRDRYGRILARVYVNGKDLSQKLIEEYLGRPYDGGHRAPWCEGGTGS